MRAGRTLTGSVTLWWQVGLVVHLFSATHFTYNKRKAIQKSPMTTGLLALTGTVLLVRPTRPLAHCQWPCTIKARAEQLLLITITDHTNDDHVL